MDIKALAREAGIKLHEEGAAFTLLNEERLTHFARLIAEECAKVCEDEDSGFGAEGEWCAGAIRDKFGG